MDPIAHAERQIEAALDDLVAMGALQKRTEWTSNLFLIQMVNLTS